MVRARMEVRKAARSGAWEAIRRIAGRYIDFDVDDSVALEARAQAEFVRTRAGEGEARGGTVRPIWGAVTPLALVFFFFWCVYLNGRNIR